MSDDCPVDFCDEGHDRPGLVAQHIDEIGLG
jgi:hypothetical protein